VLRLATAAGWRAAFEAPSAPLHPTHSTDVVLERGGATVLVEVWNRVDDLGAAIRSSDRKLADVRDRAPDARVVWLLVDTATNRSMVRRYPAIFRARFAGSSAACVAAIRGSDEPPEAAAIAWIDPRPGTLRPIRAR
jgi:hypothetical protein